MLLAEPQPTPADFHFHIGQIPVRVTGWFWPAAGLFGWGLAQSLAGDDTRTLLVYLLVWVLVVFCSILIHELGHALAFAACGQSSRIVLYHFGGLAVPIGMPAPALRTPSRLGRFSGWPMCSIVPWNCCYSDSHGAWFSGASPWFYEFTTSCWNLVGKIFNDG